MVALCWSRQKVTLLPTTGTTSSLTLLSSCLTSFLPCPSECRQTTKMPHHIIQHMDYEAAIKALARPIYKPGHNMVTYADLIMVCARLESIISHTLTDEWVMGHASKRRKMPRRQLLTLSMRIASATQTSDLRHSVFSRENLHPHLPLIPAFKWSWN